MSKNILLYICALIMIHHYKKHINDKKKSFFNKIFQINDIDNHETWVLFLFGIWIGMRLI
jgi:hypothetical protein